MVSTINVLLLLLGYITISAAVISQKSTNFAVLVAGSSGYFNYRHQADIAHAYQILTKLGGIPPENIITMMYNDVVQSNENPFPGQLFNEPGGKDVYHGISIDYEMETVTAESFLNVLKGIQTDPQFPVLKTGPNDNIFIYYADHGAAGLVGMPSGNPLFASDLMAAFQYMYDNKMYNQMVFYLEACESGSMFAGILPQNISVFATTAANPTESSYAFYFNATLQTYMADEYSIRWMQDSTQNWQSMESLMKQFEDVQKIVVASHPQQYGDSRFDTEPIEDFEGCENSTACTSQSEKKRDFPAVEKGLAMIVDWYSNFEQKNGRTAIPKIYNNGWKPSTEVVDSRDVVLATLQHRYLNSVLLEDKEMYATLIVNELKYRLEIDERFYKLIALITGVEDEEILNMFIYGSLDKEIGIDFLCLKSVYAAYENECSAIGGWDEYSLKYVRSLVNLCAVYGENDIMLALYDLCFIEPMKEEIEHEINTQNGLLM